MTLPLRAHTCCFSGYRPEKIPGCDPAQAAPPAALADSLLRAVCNAAGLGYTHFVTGMSRGFDLWAAQAVLALAGTAGLSLVCAIPFDGQDAGWPPAWRAAYDEALRHAAQVFLLAPAYAPGCYHTRNRFLVESSSRLICYFDGQPGGTAYTVRYAKRRGLELDNVADPQVSLGGLLYGTGKE
ncbi:SLOG family protein [Intestinibacillus massiliensis]|uniref:SLOG family protein n=1 Tax=Intestinibacillus massiliensis TaxID=1871029 RepID=UPI000B34FB60|nr:SLOG family protein [Intestinibacillus massiliensis]